MKPGTQAKWGPSFEGDPTQQVGLRAGAVRYREAGSGRVQLIAEFAVDSFSASDPGEERAEADRGREPALSGDVAA